MNKKISVSLITCLLLLATLLINLPQASSQEFPHVDAEKTISPQRVREGESVQVTIRLRGAGGVILTPVDVLLILDRSGSMTGQKIKDAKEAAIAFLEFTDDQDKVGLVTYSNYITIDSELEFMNTANKDLLIETIDEFEAGGATNIYGAIVTANDLLLKSPRTHAPLVEILLTDGLHNFPTELPNTEFEALAEEAKDEDIIIYTIGLGQDVNAGRLQMIAETTGGEYYFAPTSTELKQIFEEIGGKLAFAGTNIVVTETVPSYISYNEDASKSPDEVSTDGDTTLIWEVGTLKVGEEWEVTYTANAGEDVETSDLVVQCRVEYVTAEAASAIINLTPGLIFHDIALTLLVAEPEKVVQGALIDVTATVESRGVVRDTFEVEISLDATLLSSRSVTLDPAQSINVTYSWNTTDVDPGRYNITVTVDPDDRIWEDHSDNKAIVEVEVTPPPGNPMIVFIFIVIMILVITVAGVAYARLRERAVGPTCEVCREPLSYDSRTGRWYCPRCKTYVTRRR